MNFHLLNPLLRSRLALAALVCAGLLCTGSSTHAQGGGYGGTYMPPAETTDPIPALDGVTIADKLNTRLPLETVLVNDHGKTVTLRDVISADRPTILQIGYMRCPQLCSLVMNALVRGMQGMDLSVGKDFDVVSLSINPLEKPDLAAGKKAGYVAEYGRGADGTGWHFMTGEEPNVHAVAQAVGFEYRLQPNGEYSHAAAVFLITPDGRLSRVLYGVKYEPNTLRMGLLEASQGKIGTTLDRIILWCHVYNPDAGGYVLFALRLMKLGGAITVAVMVAGLAYFWRSEVRRKRLAAPELNAVTH